LRAGQSGFSFPYRTSLYCSFVPYGSCLDDLLLL
jgi:hypothetical protein